MEGKPKADGDRHFLYYAVANEWRGEVRLWGRHHTSRVGEGPGAAVSLQGPEAGGCGWAVAAVCHSGVCPLQS
jgi:hypothetical protein